MPKVIEREDFIEAWNSFDPEIVLGGFKDEASRMVKDMDEWMITHEKYDPYQMFEYWTDVGYIDLVKKAKRYRKRIYNRNAELKKLVIDKGVAETRYKQTFDEAFSFEVTEIVNKISEIHEEQIVNCWRIAKIYGYLLTKGNVNFIVADIGTEEEPFKEYQYDPEAS